MRGLPDFGAPLGVGCFAAFDQPGGVLALPGSLGLATDAAGVPRLTLERFRSSNPAPANQAYGLVSARFTMRWLISSGALLRGWVKSDFLNWQRIIKIRRKRHE